MEDRAEDDVSMKRSSMNLYLVFLSLLVVTAPVLAFMLPVRAGPLETLDQSNDPAPSIGIGVLPVQIPASIYQSFRPTLPQLTSVDVRLENVDTSAREVTVKIRVGTPSGTVMAAQNVPVPGPLPYPGALFHVTFGAPLQVTPGSTYLIEVLWGTLNASGVYWESPDADTYPGGNGFGIGGTPAGWDLNFQTWGPQRVGGEIISTAAGIYASLVVVTAASVAVLSYGLAHRRRSLHFPS